MSTPLITIITPTTGKSTLYDLIESMDGQDVPYVHILLWDDKREDSFLYPNSITLKVKSPYDLDSSNRYSIIIPGSFVQGVACGSSLRAIGLMAANTDYVSFADDDIWYEKGHFRSLLDAIKGKEWAYCKRKVWKKGENGVEYIGIDNFESVGDSENKKVPYEMVDNNSMIFSRRYGASGAVLYREVKDYCDDRLFYAFLKKHAGEPGKTDMATVNHICPTRLEKMFMEFCDKEE